LEQAIIGVARDPVAPYKRMELGLSYYDLAEFSSAQSVWEDGLLLAPEDPQLHVDLGLVHLQQVEDSKNKAERLAQLEAATQHLNTAFKLFDDTDPSRNNARFLLSLVYSSAGRYADAVRELRALDRCDYCDLAVAIYLAHACLSNNGCAEAERRFRQVAAEVDENIKNAKEGSNQIVETPPGADDMLLGTALAYARLGIADTLIQREILLGEAMAEVRKVRVALKDLTRAELREYWEGRCTFLTGLILIKLGHIDEAIPKLEAALAESTDAETYFALADALERKVEPIAEPAQKTGLVRRALFCYQEARRLDWNGELEEKIAKAIARLQPAAPK
jgi:tetratricopeptide (TPR) repeat protein